MFLHLYFILVSHLVVGVDSLVISLEKYWEVGDVHVCCRIGAGGNVTCLGSLGQPVVPLRHVVRVVSGQAFRVVGAQEVNLLLHCGLSFWRCVE